MTNKYTEDDYCDLFSKKICYNCGKCFRRRWDCNRQSILMI